jgi:hypothetical protein
VLWKNAVAKICPFVVIASAGTRARSETLRAAQVGILHSRRRYPVCSQWLTRKRLSSDAGHFLAMHKPGKTAEIRHFPRQILCRGHFAVAR